MYEQLELPIDRTAEVAPAPVEPVLPEPTVDDAPSPPEPFGTWLLAQRDRRGLIGALAKAAGADTGFPKRGEPDDVRARLTGAGAEGDMFEAIDDAERAWLATF